MSLKKNPNIIKL